MQNVSQGNSSSYRKTWKETKRFFDTFQAVGVSMKKREVKVLIGLLLAKCVISMVKQAAEKYFKNL